MINNKTKTLGRRGAHLITSLYERNKSIFRVKDVAAILEIDPLLAKEMARTLVNRGVVCRLRKGLFQIIPYQLGHIKTYMGNRFLVARELMNGHPYYISHASAMELHGMLTQPQFSVVISTTRARVRKELIQGTPFISIMTKPEQMFGIQNIWITKQDKIKVSDIEKTLLDGCRHPQHVGGISVLSKGLWIQRKKVKLDKLINYLDQMKIEAVTRRIGYLLDLFGLLNEEQTLEIKKRLNPGMIRLDPILPAFKNYNTKWGLQLNIPKAELLNSRDT